MIFPEGMDKEWLARAGVHPGKVHAPSRAARFPHAGAAIFLFTIMVFVGCSAQIGYGISDGRGVRFMAEYAAYALPAFAAAAAAMTIFEWRVKVLFWFAFISVFLGLLLYIYAQGNLEAVWTTAIILLGVILTAILIPFSNHIDRVRKWESKRRQAVVGACFLIFVSAECVVLPQIFSSPRPSPPSNKLHCVETYKDLQGNSLLTCTSND